MISWLRGLWLRVRYYLFRARYDREMEEEMRFHLEIRAAEHAARRPERRRRARRRAASLRQSDVAAGIPPNGHRLPVARHA